VFSYYADSKSKATGKELLNQSEHCLTGFSRLQPIIHGHHWALGAWNDFVYNVRCISAGKEV
jgi:hypothetical protein